MGMAIMQPLTSVGMIPRAVHHLFTGIEKRQEACVAAGGTPPTFEIITQFLELYNEEIIDLFDGNRENVGCHGYHTIVSSLHIM